MIIYDKKASKFNPDKEENQYNYFNIKNFFKNLFSQYRYLVFIAIGILLILLILLIIFLFNKSFSDEPVSHRGSLSIELIGTNIVTISRGSSFLDPGYVAIDKKEGDLTDKVQITGILDTSTLGTYTRYYTVVNQKGTIVEIKRNIIVKERTEKSILTITLNGNQVINLKLGTAYNEQGFVANDSIEGNLTDKVQVINKVNISKEGTYTVTYKVTNSSGDSKEVYRTVKVIKESVINENPTEKPVNLSVLITTNTTVLTNKSVTIKISIIGTGYSHTILPSSQKTYNSVIDYSVVINGTAIFTVYDVNGNFKTYQKTINNIDKIAPIGNCTGKIDGNKTIVSTTANDKNGIRGYIYQSGTNKSSMSTNKSYTFYFQTKTASVLVYDSAGNYKSINCQIEGKITYYEPLKVGTKANPKTSIPCNGSRTSFNNALKTRVNQAGVRTRNGAVAAGIYLSTEIGYKIPYFYAGGHYHYSWDRGDNFLGISPQWGCMTKMTVGETGKQKKGNSYPAGIDCTGFIGWILANAGWTKEEVGSFSGDNVKTKWNGVIVETTPFKGSGSRIKAGDVVWRTGHMAFVINVEKDVATIAHEKNFSSGLIVEKFNLSTGKIVGGSASFTTVMLMDNFYNKG